MNTIISKELKTLTTNLSPRLDNIYFGRESREKFTKELEKIGFNYIGSGISRNVYGNGEIVLKLQFHFDDQNSKEVENYFSLSDEEKKLFPEILDYDHSSKCSWIIAEQVEVVDECESDIDWFQIERALDRKLENLCLYVADLHRHNVGVSKKDGRMVVVDIGIGNIHSKKVK